MNLKSERYIGGSLNEKYLIVKMLIKDDKGNYLCIVINVVGVLLWEVVFGILDWLFSNSLNFKLDDSYI